LTFMRTCPMWLLRTQELALGGECVDTILHFALFCSFRIA
jgi:hypothetical protein